MAVATVPDDGRRSTPVVEVVPGLWVAKPLQRIANAETRQERLQRRFVKRTVFSRPLVPRPTAVIYLWVYLCG